MSAPDRALVEMLFAADRTRENTALRRIVTLYTGNARMAGHELRTFAIALEGLGASPGRIRYEIQAAIQLKRDRVEQMRQGAANEAP